MAARENKINIDLASLCGPTRVRFFNAQNAMLHKTNFDHPAQLDTRMTPHIEVPLRE